MSKIICIEILLPVRLKPKSKNAESLLKFDAFDKSNIPTLILMSKMTFKKYLPAAMEKSTPKLRLLRNSCLIFQVFRSRLGYLIKVSLNIYNKLSKNCSPSLNSKLDYKMKVVFMKYTACVYYYP